MKTQYEQNCKDLSINDCRTVDEFTFLLEKNKHCVNACLCDYSFSFYSRPSMEIGRPT